MFHERRRLLATGAGLISCVVAGGALNLPASKGSDDYSFLTDLVVGIDRDVIFPGRQGGTTWFHPRSCMVPTTDGMMALMTLQSISGSDVFGPVHWTTSSDFGRSWTPPEPIPGLGRQDLAGGWEVGICDVVPEYHPQTDTVLAVGHNVFYENGVLARPQRSRWPVFVIRSTDGRWSEPQRLVWDDPRGSAIATCGCAQRIVLDDGDLLVPFSFGPVGRTHRSVTSLRCVFDGRDLRIRQVGTELIHPSGRGLLEPSLAHLDERFFMTIRAEDDKGYVSRSDDGLCWEPQRPWCWDDGEPLAMSSTQQHWLTHSEGLFLVYTRKAEENINVMRWRAPLFLAEVDRETTRLIRASEKIVLPLIGDGIGNPSHVARMGNFHTLAASPKESWVSVGETLPEDGWQGDTLLARVRWSRPNCLAQA
ncbi:sialidase family protein [Tautonia rosea]|uniref:sialidase family protein n=1 Tax=Tautonia rosea TaxID=2728037 RepID=UPI001472DA50|nr:sialidase family protein [Tautonia rosea]